MSAADASPGHPRLRWWAALLIAGGLGATHWLPGDDFAVTDPVSLFGVLVVGILLWPDLSSLTAFGVNFTRRILSVESQTEAAIARTEQTQAQLEMIKMQIALQANAQASNTVIISSDSIAQVQRALQDKIVAYQNNEIPSAPSSTPNVDADEGLRLHLIEINEELSRRLRTAAGEGFQGQLFKDLFRDEIAIVQAARNNVSHARPISDTEVRHAVEIGEKLTEVLRQRD